MEKSVSIPVNVKCRLGVDNDDSYEFAYKFIETISTQTNVKHFIIHARKCWLQGLSPAENRNIPPLEYHKVYKLKNDFPDLQFTINGGFKTHEQINEALAPEKKLKGVMIGRAAYLTPWFFTDIDRLYFK